MCFFLAKTSENNFQSFCAQVFMKSNLVLLIVLVDSVPEKKEEIPKWTPLGNILFLQVQPIPIFLVLNKNSYYYKLC